MSKVDYYNKVVKCIDGKGMPVEVRGILQQISVKQILVLQLQRFLKKGCQVYGIHILDLMKRKIPSL